MRQRRLRRLEKLRAGFVQAAPGAYHGAMDQRPPRGPFAALRVAGKNFSRITRPLRAEGPFHEGFADASPGS